jgi:hypothetical protein
VHAKAFLAGGDPDAAAASLLDLRDRIARSAPPEYIYRKRWGRYEEVHALPAVERRLMEEIPEHPARGGR